MRRFFTIFIFVVIVLATVMFLSGWWNVQTIQREANNKYLPPETTKVLMQKCRDHDMFPSVKPDRNFLGFINERVQRVYCVGTGQYNDVKLYNANDGRPYLFDRAKILEELYLGEDWKESYGNGFHTHHEIELIGQAENLEVFWNEYDQQALDEMAVSGKGFVPIYIYK